MSAGATAHGRSASGHAGGRDLTFSSEVKDLVREAYAALEGGVPQMAAEHYSEEELAGVPQLAIDWSLGVGNHLRHADIEQGETVLDLGCGGGIDTVLAARRVGPAGRAIGLDFLPEQLERTRAAAREAGLANVDTVEGEMEAIPLPDASVDHIVSNGVINLSPRKARVFAECARVLRPGGRFCVANLTVVEEELPAEVLTHPAAWAG